MDMIADAADVPKVTIYNHFGSKEQLFTEVVGEAFEQALGDAPGSALPGPSDLRDVRDLCDLRETLTAMAHRWVAGVTRPEVTDLRLLVVGVARRFPELVSKWAERRPQRFAPVIADALRDLSGRGYLVVPDPDLADIQFYALTVYPHTSSARPSAFNSINALPRISSPAESTCSSATTPSRKGRGESLSAGSATAPATGTSAQGTPRACLTGAGGCGGVGHVNRRQWRKSVRVRRGPATVTGERPSRQPRPHTRWEG